MNPHPETHQGQDQLREAVLEYIAARERLRTASPEDERLCLNRATDCFLRMRSIAEAA